MNIKLSLCYILIAFFTTSFGYSNDVEHKLITLEPDSLDRIEEYANYKRSGLLKQFSKHDVFQFIDANIRAKEVHEYIDSFKKKHFSGYDIRHLIKNEVNSTFVKQLKEPILKRLSSYDIVQLFKNNVSVQYISELHGNNLLRHFSSYDIVQLNKNNVPLTYLLSLNTDNILDTFSSYDVVQLNKNNVDITYIEKLHKRKLLQKFSSYDISLFYRNTMNIEKLITYEREGLIKTLGSTSLVYLFVNDIPISKVKSYIESDFLDQFSLPIVHYLSQEKIDVSTFIDDCKSLDIIQKFNSWTKSELFYKNEIIEKIEKAKRNGRFGYLTPNHVNKLTTNWWKQIK